MVETGDENLPSVSVIVPEKGCPSQKTLAPTSGSEVVASNTRPCKRLLSWEITEKVKKKQKQKPKNFTKNIRGYILGIYFLNELGTLMFVNCGSSF